MLEAPMLESIKKEIHIEDMDVETLKLMLQFIYTGEVEVPEDAQLNLKLLDSAEKYELDGLKSLCFLKMFSTLNDGNAGELAMAAFKYNLDPECQEFIKNYCTT